MDLGIIKKLRKGEGVTQSEVADRVGISRKHLSGIENNRTRPSHELVLRIFGELGYEMRLMPRGTN